ncbi:MAG: DUF4230 domain-containing protein [Bacillaceae bacterium]
MIKKLGILIVLVSVIILIYKLNNPAQVVPGSAVTIPQAETKSTIVTKETVLGRLKSLGQIVSMQQEFSKEYIDVDDSLFGERQTRFTVAGTYKMGLEIKDIEVVNIDGETIHIALPKVKLISLEIPFNQIEIDKVKGKLRRKMGSDEEKQFYKVIEKNIRKEISSDKEIQNQANLHNKQVIEDLLKELANVEYVVFR